MTSKAATTRVIINKIPVDLPIYLDLKTTHSIAQEIEASMKAFEEEHRFVDTQLFAILTAFEYAVQKHKSEAKQEHDLQALIRELDAIATRLTELEERFHIAPLPDEEQR